MNCHEFNERLYEILDESPEFSVQAAAREHLRQCGECRRVFARELALARTLRDSLDRATAGLVLRPETGRNIQMALESRSPVSVAWARVVTWFAAPVRPLGVCAAFLLVLLLIHGHRRAPQAAGQSGLASWVIDVPISTQTRILHLQGNAIEDATISTVVIGHADFPEPTEPQSKRL